MKYCFFKTVVVAGALTASCGASAAVMQTFGAGSAVHAASNRADFELNTALAAKYVENGISFTYVGAGNNVGCGFAGADCGLDPALDFGPGFHGNYLATDGKPSYISIALADGRDMRAIEFAASTGYLTLNGYWQTYERGVLTGSAKFTAKTPTVVLGLRDVAGFDELRYFAFSSASGTATSFSYPAIDAVRIEAVQANVPEPATMMLFAASFAPMLWACRARGSRRRRR